MRVDIADTFVKRLKGWMNVRSERITCPMLFPFNRSVHTFFMKMDIVVVYLNEVYDVLDVEILPPHRVSMGPKGSLHTLELLPSHLNQKWQVYHKEITILEEDICTKGCK